MNAGDHDLRYKPELLDRIGADQQKLANTMVSFTEIRACPQDDGTITYLGMTDFDGDEYLLTPKGAFRMMLAGVRVTLALNDSKDAMSHWETEPALFFKV